MKYLKTVVLKNFQSHKHSIIDFNEGLNVIVGQSDTGKSAIIRGIKWALYNEPAGDYFIREGERECSVSLEFSDGTKITRLRNSSQNAYILNKNDGEEIKFEGFGTSVPQEIIDEIGIRKILLDSNESTYINLGEQLEGPFLLSEKTSTRASAIGRLIGVNIIDDALKDALRDLRNTNINKKNLKEITLKIEDDLRSYTYLDELSKQINRIEKISNSIKEKTARLNDLKNLLYSIKKISSDLRETKILLDGLSNIERLESIIKDILILDKDYGYFVVKKSILDELSVEINRNVDLLDRMENLIRAEVIYKDIKSMQKIRINLLQTKDDLQNNTRELNMFININTKLAGLPYIKSIIECLENDIKRIISLTHLERGFLSSQRSIAIGDVYIKKLDEIDRGVDIYNDLENNLKNLNVLEAYHERWLKLNAELKKEVNNMKMIGDSIDLELDKYKSLLKNIEVCPLCLGEIDGEKIQHIIEHYK